MKRNNRRGHVQIRGEPSNNQLLDLDRELELLRRKRQLIEDQQQQYVQQNFQRQNPAPRMNPWEQPPRIDGYDQPGNSYGQLKFSGLYDSQETRPGFGHQVSDRDRKRPYTETPWQQPAPKHFKGQHETWNSKATYSKPAPIKRFRPNVRGRKPYVPPIQQQFDKPTELLKRFTGKSARRPMESHVHPHPKNIPKLPNAIATPSPVIPKKKPTEPSPQANIPVKPAISNPLANYVLKADEEPPKKIQGKLEFALGTIMKEVRERNEKGSHAVCFEGFVGTKAMKQAIRDRIKAVMLGKVVGNVAEIVSMYSEQYSANNDDELLQRAVEAENEKIKHLKLKKETETAEPYFKQNMTRILNQRLDEMFTKLESLSGEVENDNAVTECVEKIWEITKAASDSKPQESTEKDTPAADDTLAADDTPAGDDTSAKDDTPAGDNTETNMDAALEDEQVNKNNEDNSDNGNLLNLDPEITTSNVQEYYERLMEVIIKRQLPRCLTAFKRRILSWFDVDREFVKLKALIYKDTTDILKNAAPEEEAKVLGRRHIKHFVMVIGNPVLPKRLVLKEFLQSFNPSTIKKHRNLHNILFVGFENQKDFEDILAADKTVLGNIRLTIKESKGLKQSKALIKKGQIEINEPVSIEDAVNEVKQLDNTEQSINTDESVFDADLNNQINDLLTDIKNSVGMDNEAQIKEENTVTQANNSQDVEDNSVTIIDETEPSDNGNINLEIQETITDGDNKNQNGVETAGATAGDAVTGKPTKAAAKMVATTNTVQTRRSSRMQQNN